MKHFLCVGLLLGVVSSAYGWGIVNGTWDTGDETGWTRWTAGRGAPTWQVTGDSSSPPEGRLQAPFGGAYPSFGWYQIVQVPANTVVHLTGQWALSNPGWAEFDMKSYSTVPSDATIKNDLDANIQTSSIAFKSNGTSGTTPGYPAMVNASNINGWSGGNGGVVTSQGYVVVLLKLGVAAGTGTAYFDNIALTPEPVSLLLVGLAFPLIRRRLP